MGPRIYLQRYRLRVDRVDLPVVIRRSADEATFAADDLETGERVAVQVVPVTALRENDREQLTAEARAARQINHINLPQLRDFGFEGDQLVYVTEFLEGETAEDWVRTKGSLPATAALRVVAQAVSALVAANLHGIVHHAVHPGNIILLPHDTAPGDGPRIKLLNLLGLAPAPTAPVTDGSSLHPADFLSPEQLQGGPITFRSEIYSLGCTLFFLLRGAAPAGGVAALRTGNGIAAPVRQLMLEMTARDPADRPSDPVVLHRKIQECLASSGPAESAGQIFARPAAMAGMRGIELASSGPSRARGGWLALAALLLLGGLAFFFFAPRQPRSTPQVRIAPTPDLAIAPSIAAAAATATVAPNESSIPPAIAEETPVTLAQEETAVAPAQEEAHPAPTAAVAISDLSGFARAEEVLFPGPAEMILDVVPLEEPVLAPVAIAQPSLTPAAPPAEGPSAPPQTTASPRREAEVRRAIPLETAAPAPEKPRKPRRAQLPSFSGQRRERGTSVGHILFPAARPLPADEPSPSPEQR